MKSQVLNFKLQINSKFQISKSEEKSCRVFGIWSLVFICNLVFGIWNLSYSQENKVEPIIVNGDQVEYLTEANEVSAKGNVEVIYKGTKLSCNQLTVNTVTKEGKAQGNVRLEDASGVIEGESVIYNFQKKTGVIVDSEFRAYPYFGRAKSVEKVSDKEFIARIGFATTCNLDKPHYRIGAKQINLFPKDKIQTRGDVFYFRDYPFLYLSRYNHSLKDPLMHVRLTPGKNKEWGPFMLSAWRYNLTDNINGRIYLDYRDKLGLAQGFGANYDTKLAGRGDLKFYFANERLRDPVANKPSEFQRYFARLRHKWDIDERTNLVSEIYKISDEKRKLFDPESNILKDYFYREYEKDSQPLSYILLHHSFSYSSMDLLAQKRTNHWFDQLDKLPELKYSLPSLQIGDTPFYFENNSSFANLNKKAETAPLTLDEESVTRLDTTNKFSLPSRVSFFEVTPFVANRETIYDKGANGASLPVRTIFLTGVDMSTKFYRIFDVKSNFLGFDVNGLRHIITPTISYAYNHEPTISSRNLKQIDAVDALTRSNSVTLGLSNKLQTKRKKATVDLLDARINTSYIFKPKTAEKRGSNLSDIIFELTFTPYSWMRFDGDTTFKRSGSRSDPNYRRFSNANYDIYFDLGKERSLGIGQRYQRKGGNELTYSSNWRLNPKWKISTYHRYNLGNDPTLANGWREQQYGIARDLHCWTMEINYNVKRSEGEIIWLVFRLKAFPEMDFGFDQSYHEPKSGSQQNL